MRLIQENVHSHNLKQKFYKSTSKTILKQNN